MKVPNECFNMKLFWLLKELPAIFPRILGHEAIGWVSELVYIFWCNRLTMFKFRLILMWCRVVESVGEDVTEITKGDIVIPIFIADCEECIDCKSTKSNLCSNFPFKISPWMLRYANTTRFTDLNGEIIHHFMFVSSFSEYTVVDIANLLKIDPTIPPNRACLLSCGVSTGIGSTKLNRVAYGFFMQTK